MSLLPSEILTDKEILDFLEYARSLLREDGVPKECRLDEVKGAIKSQCASLIDAHDDAVRPLPPDILFETKLILKMVSSK